MSKSLLTLSALALASLGATASAQTASATVREACTIAAPTDSLVAEANSPMVFTPNANGVVIMEVEAVPPAGDWVEETIFSGFGGESYYRWNGNNFFGSAGQGILTYRFRVDTPGDYIIRVHCRVDGNDPSEKNDVWARLDGHAWEKLFYNIGSGGLGRWTFNPRYEDDGDFPIHFLSAGEHTWQFSGRSTDFKIDRVHVIPLSTWFANLSDPQTDVERDRPLIGSTFRVEIDDPNDEANISAGTLVSWLGSTNPGPNFPCGTVFKGNELLLSLAPSPTQINGIKTWNGGPVDFQVDIRNDISLIGINAYTQGVFLEPGNLTVTDGLDLVLGNM